MGRPFPRLRLGNHWLNNYDWRKHEADINNGLPQFTMPIIVDGFGEMTVHFIHKKSLVPNSIPLIFIHGWPGSFHEVHKILPLLTDAKGGEQAFHIVAPRLDPTAKSAKFKAFQDIAGAPIQVNEGSMSAKLRKHSIN